KGHISRMLSEYELCARYCNIQVSQSACFNYHIKQCHGACVEIESVESYNERAEEVKERLSTVFEEDFLLIDVGRTAEEISVVKVEYGKYAGYGYAAKEDAQQGLDALLDVIKPFPGNPETTKIIQRFMSQNPAVRTLAFN
ncbi:MAG: DNA polymerase III subunit epsilon, partial [Cyanothece sp. SIO1E1]|nr:DNA polymerase III subunit epsilon [Cyanothece sp. SIO1E1]